MGPRHPRACRCPTRGRSPRKAGTTATPRASTITHRIPAPDRVARPRGAQGGSAPRSRTGGGVAGAGRERRATCSVRRPPGRDLRCHGDRAAGSSDSRTRFFFFPWAHFSFFSRTKQVKKKAFSMSLHVDFFRFAFPDEICMAGRPGTVGGVAAQHLDVHGFMLSCRGGNHFASFCSPTAV